ncbi:MAG: glycoside hydrolase family 10 protein [Cyanobacteria bacterium P01_A01_bin.105]
MTLLLSGLPSQALSLASPSFVGHPLSDCVESLAQERLLGPVSPSLDRHRTVSQQAYANAVLQLFPGEFTAANEALGITFDGDTEVEQLLNAALESRATPQQTISRAQALTVLTTGGGLPYQPDALQLLRGSVPDYRLIPRYSREGVAAALAAGAIYQANGENRLHPNRGATVEQVAGDLCLATGRVRPGARVPVMSAVSGPEVGRQTQELRGVWLTNIDSDVLFSQARLAAGLETLAELNFNTVYPTVWNWGYTLFPSAVAERVIGHQQGLYPDLDDTGDRNAALEAAQGDRDMLLELIDLAHPLGLRVMPWVEFGFMAPAESALTRRHPDWLTQKRDGSLIAKEGRHPRVWMNPFHPEVQQFLLEMMGELAANYDIDGLQVDDHFGLPYEYGYDPYTVALYQSEHDGAAPPADPKDTEWTRWRADKITEFMAQVFKVVKERRPQAILSVSPNPHEFAYEYYLQDWDSWVNRGYVEELVIQLYRSDLGRFVWEMNRDPAERARRHIPTGIGILSGLRGRPVSSEWIAEQVRAVRDRNFAGVSFFFYETLWLSDTETPAQRQTAFRSLFPHRVRAPQVGPPPQAASSLDL